MRIALVKPVNLRTLPNFQGLKQPMLPLTSPSVREANTSLTNDYYTI